MNLMSEDDIQLKQNAKKEDKNVNISPNKQGKKVPTRQNSQD